MLVITFEDVNTVAAAELVSIGLRAGKYTVDKDQK